MKDFFQILNVSQGAGLKLVVLMMRKFATNTVNRLLVIGESQRLVLSIETRLFLEQKHPARAQ